MKMIIWVCPKCKKVLTSLYEKQMEQYKLNHNLIHEKKEVEE